MSALHVKQRGTLCAKRRESERRSGQRYCAKCHAASMRGWRKRAAEKRKAVAAELSALRSLAEKYASKEIA